MCYLKSMEMTRWEEPTPAPVLLRQTANGAEIALNPCIRATQCRDSTIMESRACRQARYSGDRSSQWPSSPLPGSDRKRVVWGKSVSVRVDLGGRRSIKKKKIEPKKIDV